MSELRALLRLAWPLALSQMALVSLGIVDVAVVGHTSSLELAGSSIGRQVAFLWIGLPLGVATALEGTIAQARGAGDRAGATRAYRAGFRATGIAALPMIVVAIASTYTLPAFGVEPAVCDRARAFVIGQAPGLVFFVLFVAQKSLLSVYASTWSILLVAGVANAVNLLVCNLLVRGDAFLMAMHLPAVGAPSLGALGAGMASSVASLVLALGAHQLVKRHAAADVNTDVAPTANTDVRRALEVGVPVGLQFMAEIGVFSLVGVLSGRLGAQVASAHQIALSLASFTFMGTIGISGATSVRVGLALGEKRPPRRAGLTGIGVGALYMCFTGLTFVVASDFFVGIFSDEPAVHMLGARLLLIAAAFQLFDGVQGVASGALRGVSDVRFAFATNVVAHWFFGLPLALYLAFHLKWGAVGLWWGLTLGLALVSIALLARFIRITRVAPQPSVS